MRKLEIVLASLLLLVTANSTYYFLFTAKATVVEWLVFNACAISSLVFVTGFIVYLATGDRTITHMALLPLFFFGGLGLYLFPWTGFNIIAQVSHIIMVLNIAATVLATAKANDYKAAATGMFIGIVLFSFFISFQQTYAYAHPKDFQRILGVDVGVFQDKMTP